MDSQFFHKRFEEEVLLSEQLRARILTGMFLFASLYTRVVISLFGNSIPDDLKKGASMRIFLFCMFAFCAGSNFPVYHQQVWKNWYTEPATLGPISSRFSRLLRFIAQHHGFLILDSMNSKLFQFITGNHFRIKTCHL
jgi:hypothetical protein